MPTIVSSALTFLDTTDQNQLSAYLTSNYATVQTCTSDKNVYSPDWTASAPLVLKLNAFYDGQEMKSTELKDKVTWAYKDGNKDEVTISNSTTYVASTNELRVKDNVLKNCASDTITFICKIDLGNDVDILTVQMTYTLITDAKAVSFYLGMPDGDTFTNQEGTKQIIAYAYRGVEEIQAGADGTIDSEKASFTWYKYNASGEWEEITDNNDTPKELTIQGTSVTNIASFKCVMKYKGVDYIGVATVRDITDAYISEIFTIGGDVFKNGIGGSAAYIIVRRNGNTTTDNNADFEGEIDPLKGDVSEHKASASIGEYWYQIDNPNDRILYKQYTASGWTTFTDHSGMGQELTYTWTLIDKDGKAKNFSDGQNKKFGKVIYVSCNDIDNTGTVQCAVTKD